MIREEEEEKAMEYEMKGEVESLYTTMHEDYSRQRVVMTPATKEHLGARVQGKVRHLQLKPTSNCCGQQTVYTRITRGSKW